MSHKSVSILFSLAILVLGVLAWAVGRREPTIPFTPSAWRSATSHMRDSLSAQLARSGGLLGQCEEKVIELLGPPDFREERIVYNVGPTSGSSQESRSALVIHLDNRGHAIRVSGSSFPGGDNATAFDPERWQRASDEERLSMALDVVRSRLFLGSSRDEIISRLGEPTYAPPLRLVYYGRSAEGSIRPRGRKLMVVLVHDRVSDITYGGS